MAPPEPPRKKKVPITEPRNPYRLGVWVWGIVTVILAVAVLGIVAFAWLWITPATPAAQQATFKDGAPGWLPPIYQVLKDLGTLIGVAIGFSVLGWSHFFQHMAKWEDDRI